MNINFGKSGGRVPVIVQDNRNGRVLMLGYMNRQAFLHTLQTGKVTFFSRSRQQLWTKGETSGNELLVESIQPDCDGDTLLIRAIPTGPVCHTGEATCFGTHTNPGWGFLFELERIIYQRKQTGEGRSYTRQLLDRGTAAMGRKLVEEATEVLVAVLSEGKKRVAEETADLIYHLLVLLADQGIELQQVEQILQDRHRLRTSTSIR